MPKKRGLANIPKMNPPETGEPRLRTKAIKAKEDFISSFTVFLSTLVFVLIGSMIIYRYVDHMLGWLYFIFYIFMHLFINRYFVCTKCDHFGEKCNSIFYGGYLAKLFYQKREGAWNGYDLLVAAICWGIIVFVPILTALFLGRWMVLILAIIAFLNFYFVHDILACEKCKMEDKCPFTSFRRLWNR